MIYVTLCTACCFSSAMTSSLTLKLPFDKYCVCTVTLGDRREKDETLDDILLFSPPVD